MARPPLNRSEEHTSELQSPCNLVCPLLLEKKNKHRVQLRGRGASSLAGLHHTAARPGARAVLVYDAAPAGRGRRRVKRRGFFFFLIGRAPPQISPFPPPGPSPI